MNNGKKKTIAETLLARKSAPPNPLIYRLLVSIVVKRIIAKNIDINFTSDVDVKTIKGPFVLVSNHASRLDYIYASLAMYPRTLNYVAGYNEFFRSHLKFIFSVGRAIPKKNFVSDTHAIKSVLRVIAKGGGISLFPEGMSSISGHNQPSMIASGKFLKKLGVPVYAMRIKGGYFVSTKYCLDERGGRVDVELTTLFTPEQLASMDADEIQLRTDEAIYHDPYAWNAGRYTYKMGGDAAKDLHTLLYVCPRCGAELRMKGEGDHIHCEACGNGARLTDAYELIPDDESCVIPKDIGAWHDMQRARVKEFVKDDDFEIKEEVSIGVLPDYEYLTNQATSLICGEGVLTLNREGLSFEGTRDGKPFSFAISSSLLPTFGMCTDMSRFYTFATGEFIEFYPKTPSVARWFLVAEENHRITGGAWHDYPEGFTPRHADKL